MVVSRFELRLSFTRACLGLGLALAAAVGCGGEGDGPASPGTNPTPTNDTDPMKIGNTDVPTANTPVDVSVG